jgi:photosystem II stability/assembly factor-like uncharacterized protein
MNKLGTILVGTIGQGVMRSSDSGESWRRVGVGQGLHSDAIVRCLTADPRQSEVILAGTDQGLYRTDDAGENWQLLDTPMNRQTVWAVAIDQSNPQSVLAGTGTPTPPTLYQSADGGRSWEARPTDICESCAAVGIPRPTAIAIDPFDSRSMWLGVEVDGVLRSQDGGASWARTADEIGNPDVHNLLVTAGTPKKIFVLVNDDVWTSEDDGETWNALGIRRIFPWHYPRGIAVRPDDPNVIFVTVGDATPGRTGALMRTTNAGRTWESLPLPCQPNSAMWAVAMSPTDPDLMIAGSRYGCLFHSDDGGDSWSKYWREFSEISSLTWIPA